jgi:photosystem II stability/assembly factor-like uncharacterized protein
MIDHDITHLLDRAGRSYGADISSGLAEVKKRAARHKRLRGRVTITLSLAAVAGAATFGLVLGVPDGNSAIAGRYLRISPSVQLVASSTPTNGLADVYFADATHAIGMERKCSLSPIANTTCSLEILRTSDGGVGWTSIGHQLHVTYPDSRASYPFIDFATNGKDGWIYGSKTFVTHNGGKTFADAGLGGLVMDLSIEGDETWALSRPCPPSVPGCGSIIYSTPTGGGSWHPVRAAPVLPYPYLQLVRTSAKDAYLVPRAMATALYETEDGGSSWVSSRLPALCGQLQQLTATTGSNVWVLCASAAPSDAQTKQLYRSVDAGTTWVLVATSEARAAPDIGTLPASGIVTLMTSVAPDHLWITLDDGRLLASSNGGSSWVLQVLPSSGGVEQLIFLDSRQGWAIQTPHETVSRTSDGGLHWVPRASQ